MPFNKHSTRDWSFHHVAVAIILSCLSALPAFADTAPSSSLSAISLTSFGPQIAQAPVAPPQFVPTDVTPYTVSPERNEFTPGHKVKLYQVLPARLWFNATTEVSQRLDTNVFFTYSHPRQDYAFRVLPNVSVGYNVFKNTSVFANYFVIKDTFAAHPILNPPTTQSVSWGLQHNIQLGNKTSLQLTGQARELWQASHLHQFDFLPGITVQSILNPRHIVFASTLLQLRGREYFVSPTREIDPFYTVGYIYRHGLWTFIANDTLVTNFRHPPFNHSIPPQSNMSMIADFEVNHPVLKRFPALVAFVRAEPIWNWDSHKAPGISGFDFRLFGGLRFSMYKPSYHAAMQNLRKQIKETAPPPGAPTQGNPHQGTQEQSDSSQGSTQGNPSQINLLKSNPPQLSPTESSPSQLRPALTDPCSQP